MNNDPRTEPLREWNRLERENTENAIVSSMFEATGKTSEPIESFATWLLIGTAAVASFQISNADKLLPLVSQNGFVVSGAFLCLSCIFGLVSKMYALRCKIGNEVGSAVRSTFAIHLAKYKEKEKQIKDDAQLWDISLETGIRIERVLSEFYKPFPRLVVWLAYRHFKKYADNPQIGYILLIKNLHKQSIFALLQTIAFLGFLVSGLSFVATI